MDGQSKNLTQEYIKQLQTIFPEAVTEVADKDGNNTSLKVDMEKLSILLGEASMPEDDTDYKQKYGEKFSFEWAGKRRAIAEAQKRSTGTLRPCPEGSEDWENTENLYIEGDNLEVLKLLQDSYLGAIKMIYIDPPYNTGKDFVYKDNYRDNLSNYLEQTNTTNAVNSEASGRYHTNWLNMMYPRLKLARNLLTDDGVIFISIGQYEVNNLISICDEIFGEDNKLGVVSRVMKSGSAQGDFFSPNIEYILVYSKNINFTRKFKQEISDEIIKKLYTSIETEGPRKGEKYRPFGLYQSSLDPLRGCINQRYYIEAPDGSLIIPPGNTMPSEKKEGSLAIPLSQQDKVWRWSKDRFLLEKAKGNIVFKESDGVLIDSDGQLSKWNVYSKIWLNDRQDEGMTPVDLITKWENRLSKKELSELDIPFDFAKPTELIKYLISIIGNTDNCIILDFFSGSSSTAHAVLQSNIEKSEHKKFIMVQYPELTYEGKTENYIDNEGKSKSRYIINPETGFPYVEKESEASKAKLYTICEIGKERIRRAGKKILEEQKKIKQGDLFTESAKKLDIGFKVFKLDRSNVADWDLELNTTNEKDAKETLTLEFNKVLNILKEGRTELDLLYEVMLKLGLQLTTKVEEKEINGKKVFIVGHGVMVASFAKELTYSDITKMLEYKPDYVQLGEFKVVLSDESFASNNDKVNAMQLFKQKGITNFEII